MKISFVSNYVNHHQKPLSDNLYCLTKGKYRFVQTQNISQIRKKIGFKEFKEKYVINALAETENALQTIKSSEVVIWGNLTKNYINPKEDYLIFKYSERLLKKIKDPVQYLPRLMQIDFFVTNPKDMYLLCAGAFVSYDYSLFGMYENKCYKWGYFPETKHYNINDLLSKKNKTKILWVGRFLRWKHPEDVLKIAQTLKDENYKFSITMIGCGPQESNVKSLLQDFNLSDFVTIVDATTPEIIRNYMEEAGVFLFTSDRNEGWGAVLNESMNSGCAVVASHEIGSVPYLIKNNQNGLVYHSGNTDELCHLVKELLDNPEQQNKLGKEAYNSIVSEWNAEVAAERILTLSEHIINGEQSPDLYKTGPCSKADIIHDDWFS